MKSTKIISIILIVATIFSLAACTSSNKTTEGPTDSEYGDTPIIETKDVVNATYSMNLIKSDKKQKSPPKYNWYEITANYNNISKTFVIKIPIIENYLFDSTVKTTLDNQINALNAMANSNANVNMYLYAVPSLESSHLIADIIPSEDKSDNFNYFIDNLSDKIWHGYLNPVDIEEWLSLYYLTDHHYNSYGMAVAYKQIENALKENYSDIVTRIPTEHKTDAMFYGATARSLKDTISIRYKDSFAYFDYNLPPHDIVVLKGDNDDKPTKKGKYILYGSAVPCEENYSMYSSGTFNKNENYDHYINMYPICDTITYPENNFGRNLLIIGDSFSLGLQELLASNFDNTYVLYSDATIYLWKPTDFKAYCDENNITDVIIVEQDTRIMYDYYDYSGKALVNFTVSE